MRMQNKGAYKIMMRTLYSNANIPIIMQLETTEKLVHLFMIQKG